MVTQRPAVRRDQATYHGEFGYHCPLMLRWYFLGDSNSPWWLCLLSAPAAFRVLVPYRNHKAYDVSLGSDSTYLFISIQNRVLGRSAFENG